MKQIIFTLAILVSTIAAHAQYVTPGLGGHMTMEIKKCLQSARNSDLLSEINRRMTYTDAQPIQDNIFKNVIVCNSYRLMVSETNLENGETKTNTFELGNSSQCSQLKTQLDKILSQNLKENKLTAVCNSYRLNTFIVSATDRITQGSITEYGSSSQCEEAAQQINN